MTIEKALNGKELTVSPVGRLDTTTAPDLESALYESIAEINSLILDFAGVEYISSAGLRVLLSAQKQMNQQRGKMVIRGANKTILEVFEITGFSDILSVEA